MVLLNVHLPFPVDCINKIVWKDYKINLPKPDVCSLRFKIFKRHMSLRVDDPPKFCCSVSQSLKVDLPFVDKMTDPILSFFRYTF